MDVTIRKMAIDHGKKILESFTLSSTEENVMPKCVITEYAKNSLQRTCEAGLKALN